LSPLISGLTAAAAVSLLLCVWRWGADLGVVNGFLFADGPLARWHVWFGASAVLFVVATSLSKWRSRSAQQRARSQQRRGGRSDRRAA
jgi:hypothetical protein